ncbi:hypothetical protein SAMN05660816_01380 [Niastella yeongjuensis]|nr:hypothetical protein SAMN05660816_01380 [Niastella yeongjuensis]
MIRQCEGVSVAFGGDNALSCEKSDSQPNIKKPSVYSVRVR